MKPNSIHVAIFAALSTLLSGCIKDTGANGNQVTGAAVRFSTTITKTRVVNDLWEYGDNIGVYMIPASNPPETNWNSVLLHAENKKYVHGLDEGETDDNVIFSGADPANTIVWPGGDNKFDVVAYYPWTNDLNTGHIYLVDISDQTPQRDIDLMWSNNVRNVGTGSPALGFSHMLTKLIFNIVDTGGTSLVGMSSTIDGLPTTASFSIPTGSILSGTEGNVESFVAHPASTDDLDDDGEDEAAVVEAIVLPGSYSGGYTVTFTLTGGEKGVFTVGSTTFEEGKRYIYDINLTPSASAGGASFGADGELEQIAQWGEGDEGNYPGDVPKIDSGDTPGGEPSAMWTSGQIDLNSSQYVIAGDGAIEGIAYILPIGGGMTITKSGCAGIVSVALNMKGVCLISSVKIGNHDLIIDDDGSAATPGVKSFSVLNGPFNDYIFRTDDGMPRSGDLKIVISSTPNAIVTTRLNSFGTNTDI